LGIGEAHQELSGARALSQNDLLPNRAALQVRPRARRINAYLQPPSETRLARPAAEWMRQINQRLVEDSDEYRVHEGLARQLTLDFEADAVQAGPVPLEEHAEELDTVEIASVPSSRDPKRGEETWTPEKRALQIATLRAKWELPEYRKELIGADKEFRSKRQAENQAANEARGWDRSSLSDATRQKISGTTKAKWQNNTYRESQLAKFAKAVKPRVPCKTRKVPSKKERKAAAATAAASAGDGSVQWYLKQLGKRNVLTPEKVNSLARRVQKLQRWRAVRASLAAELRKEPSAQEIADQLELPGGAAEYEQGLAWLTKCRDLLVLANIRLVIIIAKKFENMGLSMPDLVQEGVLGLITATERYDPTLGFRLSTFAVWWVRQAIQRALANKSRTIRLPVHMHDKVLSVKKARRALLQDLGRAATDVEVATHLGIPLEKLREADNAARVGGSVSLNAKLKFGKSGEDGKELGDMMKADTNLQDEVETAVIRGHIGQVLDKHLREREAFVVRKRFGLIDSHEHSLQEIGDELNITRQRVAQIEAAAIKKLRAPDVEKELKDSGGILFMT